MTAPPLLIDLRSDTVTKPSPGTEDALFFPSGTQANQTGIALPGSSWRR